MDRGKREHDDGMTAEVASDPAVMRDGAASTHRVSGSPSATDIEAWGSVHCCAKSERLTPGNTSRLSFRSSGTCW
jgi:hypothetical protein